MKAPIVAPINSGLDARLDWSERKDVITSQRKSAAKPAAQIKSKDGCFADESEAVWICPGDKLLQIRILIAAQCTMAGH